MKEKKVHYSCRYVGDLACGISFFFHDLLGDSFRKVTFNEKRATCRNCIRVLKSRREKKT